MSSNPQYKQARQLVKDARNTVSLKLEDLDVTSSEQYGGNLVDLTLVQLGYARPAISG